MKIAVEERDRLIKDGCLRYNDQGNLRIYNYNDWCKTWNDITLNSRGIIFNRKTREVVARPFPKFFNMNQRIETQERNLPWHDGFRIFRKEDGWLGILYRDNGQYKIATRGSFKSIGALWGTEYLKRYNLAGLPDEVTLLFELICPATHIIVNYGDRKDLILLAAYNRHTGKEYSWEQVEKWSHKFGFTLVESYDQNWLGYCRGRIKTVPGSELEGFVIRFNNGLRIKIKSEDYFRRSAILMNLTPLNIWATMLNGKVPKNVWQQVDVDYHSNLNKISYTLELNYEKIKLEIQYQFDQIENRSNRAIFAQQIQKINHQTAMFALFDGFHKRVDNYIMKQIRPHKNILERPMESEINFLRQITSKYDDLLKKLADS